MKVSRIVVLVLGGLVAAACSGGDASAPAPAPAAAGAAAAAAQAFVATAEPAGAVAVKAAKASATAAAQPAVVVGRNANVVKGYAVFTLMDVALPYCGETNKEDTCRTPWDYCCEDAETRTANSVLVELRGADGQPLQAALPDLRLLDVVVVQGQLQKDEHGNTVLAAAKLFRRDRPTVPDYVRWPQ